MAKILVEIVGDAKKFKSELGTAGKDAENFGGKIKSHAGGALKGLGLVAGGAALGGIALLGKGLMDGVKTAIEHEKALAQTNAVIKSTQGVAGVSSEHILKLSDSIEKMSGMDDLAVQKGENMLLTFKNIKNGAGDANKIFDQSTKILADMTVALGSDPQKQAIQLGKALNDPVKGISALSRVGVTFDEQQKELIKTYMKHGETAKAQQVILKELKGEFGGSAEAAGKTMGGQMKILQAHIEDTEQAIGEKLLPVLNNLIQWAIANWPTFNHYAMIAFNAVKDAWDNILKPTIDVIIDVMTAVVGAIRAHWSEISAIFKAAFTVIKGFVDTFLGIFTGDWGRAWKGIKEIVAGEWNVIKGEIKLIGPQLLALMQIVGEKMLEGLKAGLEGLLGLALAGLKALPAAFIGLHVLLFNAAVAVGEKIAEGLKSIVKDIAGDVADFIGKIPGRIRDFAGGVKSAATDLGSAIVDGFESGLKTFGGMLARLVKAPINAVISGWNNLSFSVPEIDTHIPGVGKVGGGSVGTPNVPLLAAGGIVTRATLAVLGESGPEAVVPLGRGGGLGGGGSVTVTVNGWVGNDQEIAEKIRNILIRTGRTTTGGALGGFA